MIARPHTRLSTAALVVVIVALAVAAAAPAGAAAPQRDVDRGPRWSTCYRDVAADAAQAGLEVRYECTQVNVPLDHDRPNGPAISLALVRVPASDTAVRRGSLFLNPGGPGGSGVDFALFFGPVAPFIWGAAATQYDIVGFDPRGVGRSTPLRCFGNLDQAVQAFPPLPFPEARDELPLFEAGDRLLDDQCTQRGNKVLEHMSTANVARDLELLRSAVGDERLSFVGGSYGSYLGQTYANLFPDRVGPMVIDGILDPIAWANVAAEVPFSVALRSDVGARDTLDEFLRQCDAAGPARCALAPDAAARLEAVLEQLRRSPLVLTDPATGESFTYRYSFAVADLLGALYDPFAYADAAAFVAFLESQADPATLGSARRTMQQSAGLVNKRGFPHYPNVVESFPGVACEDTANPTGGHDVWFEAGRSATAAFGIFGELWAWASSPCAVWQTADEDAYTGPFATTTATPILVIGNLYDPATRYEGALTANQLLGNSVLLSVDEPGHTSLGLSSCAGFLTGQYLADPQGYAAVWDGFTCPSEGNWFEKAAAGAGASDDAELRLQLMRQFTLRP